MSHISTYLNAIVTSMWQMNDDSGKQTDTCELWVSVCLTLLFSLCLFVSFLFIYILLFVAFVGFCFGFLFCFFRQSFVPFYGLCSAIPTNVSNFIIARGVSHGNEQVQIKIDSSKRSDTAWSDGEFLELPLSLSPRKCLSSRLYCRPTKCENFLLLSCIEHVMSLSIGPGWPKNVYDECDFNVGQFTVHSPHRYNVSKHIWPICICLTLLLAGSTRRHGVNT